jgi:hypothetical protein
MAAQSVLVLNVVTAKHRLGFPVADFHNHIFGHARIYKIDCSTAAQVVNLHAVKRSAS